MSITREKLKQVNNELNDYRKQAIQAATDLGYDKLIIYRLRQANNCAEISNIMSTARRNS